MFYLPPQISRWQMVYKIKIQNEVLKYTKHTVQPSVFHNVDLQMLGSTIKNYSQNSTSTRTRLSAKCHRHLAETHYSSATAKSEVSNCAIFQAEFLLTKRCVCNTAVGVRVDWMLWICVLGKTTFSSYVGLKTVSYTAVCVRIIVRLYRPGRQFTQSTPSGAESKNFPLYALLAG